MLSALLNKTFPSLYSAYAGVSDKLATGLASTVFPGEDDDAVKLCESLSDEWIIVSQEESKHGHTEVKVGPDETRPKVKPGSENAPCEAQGNVCPLSDKPPDYTKVKVCPDLVKTPDDTQVKVHSDLVKTPDETQVKVRPDLVKTPDDTQVKVHPDLVKTPDETQVKVHPDLVKTPDDTQAKVSPDETQVKVRQNLLEHSNSSQVKIHLDLLENSDNTQVKAIHNSQQTSSQTEVKVPIVSPEPDSNAPRKMEELYLKNNFDDSQLGSAHSSVSLEVHPSTGDSASIAEDLDKSSQCSLPSYSAAIRNLPRVTDPRLQVPESHGSVANDSFTDVALNSDTPLEEASLATAVIREYEIVNKETIPVCESIESRSSSPSEISLPDPEGDRHVDVSVAGLVNSNAAAAAATKAKQPHQSSKGKETKPDVIHSGQNHPSGQAAPSGGRHDASASAGAGRNTHRASREFLNLNLVASSVPSSSHSPTRLVRSPSTPTVKQMGSPPQRSPGPADFVRHRHHGQSPLQAMRHLPIVRNPYMSPLLAPDHMLMTLPHVCLVVSRLLNYITSPLLTC